MAALNPAHHRLLPVALVFATVLIQLGAAWLLSYAADLNLGIGSIVVLAAVTLAIGLNALRFLIWGYTHRRYPLSQTYPLTALFFPCILTLAWLQGDAVPWYEIAGTALITLGAAVLASNIRGEQ